LSNAFLIKIVPTLVEAILPLSRTVPSTVLTATNTQGRLGQHQARPYLQSTSKAWFWENFASEQPSISGSVGGHDKKIEDQPLPSFADRNGYLAFLVLGIRSNTVPFMN
jgi:hypothetical protein